MAKYERLFTLNDPWGLRINPALAKEIGLNESIIFLQLEYLISISDNERDGRLWTYQSTRNLRRDYFPWWGIDTINRAINRLQERGLIIVGNYNRKSYDRTRWFAINFEEANKLKSITIGWLPVPK